jgi:hypothetical protein
MARLYPDSAKSRVVFGSSAEERFYNECRSGLPDAWRVYYSLTLSNLEKGDGLVDNEADFLLYHPSFGVLVVEVKGGRIGFDPQVGQFYTLNRHDERFNIKNPFQQALNWKSRFLRVLRARGIKVPVSHAVCFPNVNESDIPPSAGVEPEIIIGRERLADLSNALRDMIKKIQPERYLKFADVAAELDKLCIGSQFATRLHIRDYIDSHEARVKDIENLHEALLTPVSGQNRLAIEGEAGTGKTMLAVLLATSLRSQGKSVLLLTSNPQLNVVLRERAGDGIDVMSYVELGQTFGISLLEPAQGFTGTERDWIQYEAPQRFSDAVEKSDKRYDVVICDEAQDAEPFWWESIEKILLPDVESRFYILFDRSQGVFGAGGQEKFVPEETLPIPGPYFPLVHNYRMTSEIAAFSREFRTGGSVLRSHSDRLGYVPELIIYKDAEDCLEKVKVLLRRLVFEERLRPDEIAILSGRKPDADESVIKGQVDLTGLPLHFLQYGGKAHNQAVTQRGRVTVSTIQGFKGLEASVGIMLNLSEYNLPISNPLMSSLMYVASTRAKHLLFVFVREGDDKATAISKAVSSVHSTGTLVVDGTSSDNEMTGVITHYNPDRVGWITIDDRNFRKNSIMFFPHDVQQSGAGSIKVGDRLKFRTTLEGPAMIATDILILKV